MKVRISLVKDIIRNIDGLLQKLRETEQWFDLVIKDLAAQSIYVNSAKTFNATVAVVSTVLLFSVPLAPFGVAGLAISGVGSGATAIGDYRATDYKGKLSKDKFKEIQKDEKKLIKYFEELQDASNAISKKYKVDEKTALVVLVRYLIPSASGVSTAIKAYVDIARSAPHIASAASTMRGGATLMQASRLAQTVNIMSRSGSVMQGAQGAVAGFGVARSTTFTVGVASKVLGPLSAAVSVGDAVYSWATTNPSQEQAQEFKEGIGAMIEKYEDIRDSLQSI